MTGSTGPIYEEKEEDDEYVAQLAARAYAGAGHGRVLGSSLVDGRSVGVAFCTEDGPLVLPVNFVVHEGNVLFRTSPHNVIAAHLDGKPAAFEVDDVDDFTQSGWSVLVQGRAEFLESVDELPPGTKPVAWAEGTRSLFVSVRARSVTGRRVMPT